MVFKTFSILLVFVLCKVLAQDSSCGFVGGYALRAPNACPSDASVFCGTGLQTRCCPSGFSCVDGKYCCQDQDCQAASETHPQCPISTWSIWAYNSNGSLGWCCEPNYFGFAFLDNSGVGCQPVGQTIDTNTYHTVSQLAAEPLTCSTTSTSTTTSSTSQTSSKSSATATATATSTTSASSQNSAQASTTTSNSTTSIPEVTKSSSFGPGAIAGVAIGAAGIITLIALAAWCIGRRSKRKAAVVAESGMSDPTAYSQSQRFYPHTEKKGNVQEMPLTYYQAVPVHEIGPYEPRSNQTSGHHEMP